jgi:hypothetical protein
MLREALMRRVPHSWREAYELALIESDPIEAIGRIEYAMYTLERRYSEWMTDPGTPAELAAIRACISTLVRLMKQNPLRSHGAVLETSTGSFEGTKQEASENQGTDADYSSGVGAD